MAIFNKDSVLGGGRLAITAERVEGLDQRIDTHISQTPVVQKVAAGLLTAPQYEWFLVYTGLRTAINLRVSQLKGANAANLATWFRPSRSFDQTNTKVQALRTELLVNHPTLILKASVLKSAWTLASTQQLD